MQQMTYVQQNEIFEEYSRWNSQNQQTTEVAALNPIPSAAESLKKAKAQEEMQWERKQGFKATLDGNVARNARNAVQHDRRARNRQEKVNLRRTAGSKGDGALQEQPDAAPQPPPRRVSDRSRRPSQKAKDNSENEVQYADSFGCQTR